MPRKPAGQQTTAPTTGGDKPQAAQPPRAPRANHRARAAMPQAAAAAGNAGSANTAAPQPRRNPPRQRVSNNAQAERPRSANARQAERPKTGMRRRIVAPVTLEEKPCISQTLQWVGKKAADDAPRASEHPSRATLRMIPLGGMCEIGKNMTAYEYGNDIIIVDCGQIFPDETMPGVDAVIPDFTYVLQNRDRVRGIFITHGHEDHIGSLPYLLRESRAGLRRPHDHRAAQV